ncbi:MAG: thiamine pyrophosphate-dependent enzyme [Anaerolineales bacterium]|nr:thiamine pyrophosphate-dependent enzyme [Anaerolineales bacterium]
MTTTAIDPPTLTRQDFVSDQEVRWCPGCGDYAILAQMQKILPEIGVPRENIVFISGIGCSSRFPYYMNTYGIHSIHGRAPTLATGLKAANPALSVWVITGDGDALSIGGNHLLHALRRNVDIKIILFNNRIYGLTKGQYSPTSLPGHRTKSSPMGSIEQAFNPISVAISAEATFIARSVDVSTKHLQETLKAAAEHKGTAFVEIFQNCLIFNDNAWQHVTDRAIKDDNILPLEHGRPLVFGRESDKGIRLNGLAPEVVQLGNGISEADLLTHDAYSNHPELAFLLSRMGPPHHPTPLGIFRSLDRPTYSGMMQDQITLAREKKGPADLKTLFYDSDTWTVSDEVDFVPDTGPLGEGSIGLDEAYMDEIDQAMPDSTFIEHSLESDQIDRLMPKPAVSVSVEDSLSEVISAMRAHNIGSVLVLDSSGELAGVFTERDILTRVACKVADLQKAQVKDYMTANPTTLESDDPIAHALHLMAIYGFRHLPIIDPSGKQSGVISFRDVVSYIEKYFHH